MQEIIYDNWEDVNVFVVSIADEGSLIDVLLFTVVRGPVPRDLSTEMKPPATQRLGRFLLQSMHGEGQVFPLPTLLGRRALKARLPTGDLAYFRISIFRVAEKSLAVSV